jgi:anti-anti-sigma factor
MSSPQHPDAGGGRQDAAAADGGPPSSRLVHDLHGQLTVRLIETGLRTHAAVSGEVDHACAPTLDRVLHDCLRRPAHEVYLDLRAVVFFDCGGLNALLRARSLAERTGSALTVTAASRPVRRLLTLTGTRALFLPDDAAPAGAPGPGRPRADTAADVRTMESAGVAVGILGAAERPERLLVRLRDGRRAVTAPLDADRTAEVAAAVAALLGSPTPTGSAVVHWLSPPLPVRLTRRADRETVVYVLAPVHRPCPPGSRHDAA